MYEPFNFCVTDEQSGVNPIDTARLAELIADLKRREPAPFVTPSPHSGENYVWRVARLRKTAEAMIEAGADMVIGHGAHRVQEIDRIKGRWVFYSIGNFVFNSDGEFELNRSTP
ncbi:MAG: CapA family protein [Planctomycetota bacterium]